MFELIQPKKLAFGKEISMFSKPQIKQFLSKKVKQLENLQFNIMKYKCFKPYVSPVQIRTEYQNAEEVKIDFVRNEEVAAELGLDYDPPCAQQTYEADIQNAKARISERWKKRLFKV